MSISLYQATIPTYIQIAGSVARLVHKAEAWCEEKDLPPQALIDARIVDDMWTFAHQIKSVYAHSLYALDCVRAGLFTPPDYTDLATDFAGLRDTVTAVVEGLQSVDEAELESCIGKPVRFEAGPYKFDFVAENFLLSFSQPNFFFHATTAYDILRGQGLQIGKLDFLGELRTNP